MAIDHEWDRFFGGSPIASREAPAPPETRTKRHFDKRSEGKRLDIQGLRAVAVITVVINHLTGHPRGGFVGVDVFFVISGYLITSHLVRDLGRTVNGRSQTFGGYLSGFYRRRIRRLFPAALLVIVLTIAVSKTVFTGPRFGSTWHDGLYAAVFLANWHFYAQGTDYFTAGLPDSPFQHYWSLSVEEQFYVAWPMILFLLGVALAARHQGAIGRRRAAGAVAAGLLIVISLAYAFHQSSAQPVSAYFSTWSRGWELGLGGLLACVIPSLRARSGALTVMSWTGLLVIVASVFIARGGHGFPAPGAILPCVGAALVIAAVSPTARAYNAVLTNRAAVFIGDISYSLYLVHFPVIILLAAWMNQRGAYFYAAATLASLGISIGMYGLVERPVLNSSWLLTRAQRGGAREADGTPRTAVLALAAAAVTVVGFLAVSLWPGHQAATAQQQQEIGQALSSPPTSSGASRPQQDALTKQLATALRADSWPALHPSIDTALSEPHAPANVVRCGIRLESPASCTFGPATADHTAYLVGDSTSMAYAPMLISLVQHAAGWNVRIAGGYGCDFADKVLAGDTGNQYAAACPARNRALVAEIHRTRPELLVVSNSLGGISQFSPSVTSEINAVRGSVGHVAVLLAPPVAKDPRQCYTRQSTPVDCVAHLTQTQSHSYPYWVAQTAAQTRAAFIDTTSWYCVNGYCPAFADSIPIRFDTLHLTPEYAARLEPVALEAFRSAGLFR